MIDCIALKKEIALYVTAVNRGKGITEEKVKAYLDLYMTEYRAELPHMLTEQEASKHIRPISPNDVTEIKAIYHRLAKPLHPDISSLENKYPFLSKLFCQVKLAYKCNDLDRMQTLKYGSEKH